MIPQFPGSPQLQVIHIVLTLQLPLPLPPKLQVTGTERDSDPSFWDLGTGICRGPEKTLKPGVGEMEDKGSPGVDEQALRPRSFSSTTIRRVWADGRVCGFGEMKTVALTT